MPGPRRTRRPLVALVVLLVILGVGYAVQARDHDSGGGDRPKVSGSASASGSRDQGAAALSSLPMQARATVTLIRGGGPYPYPQDGGVFGNVERHLPVEASGYYHEYTVASPGDSDRGARRIITGAGGEYYYTADHYDSFVRVDVSR